MPKQQTLQFKYGPWALVTGASSGIGMAFARQLAAAGLNLVITARREQRLIELAQQLTSQHSVAVETLALDLSDKELLQPISAICKDKDIGLVICNAGFGFKALHQDLPLDGLDKMLDVNCRAPMMLCHHFLPPLLQRGRGGIIITSSVEACFGIPGSAAYSASKAFSKTLGEALYGETYGSGVDTLVLCPGLTDTEAPTLQGYDKNQMKGMQTPQQVVHTALKSLGKKPVVIGASLPFQLIIRIADKLPRGTLLRMASRSLDKIIN